MSTIGSAISFVVTALAVWTAEAVTTNYFWTPTKQVGEVLTVLGFFHVGGNAQLWAVPRNRHFLIADLVFWTVSPALALLIRTDAKVGLTLYLPALSLFTLLGLLILPLVFYLYKLYQRFWRYASVDELVQIVMAGLVSTGLITLFYYLIWIALERQWPAEALYSLPRSVPLINAFLVVAFAGFTRFSQRVAERRVSRPTHGSERRVAIMGAGSAGLMTVREIQRNPHLGMQVVGFIDDDANKQNVLIDGLRVLGNRSAIPQLVPEYDIQRIIIAIPRVPGSEIRQISAICRRAGVETRTLPGMHELIDGSVDVRQIRPVQIDDLLRREPIATDLQAVRQTLAGRRVLVTGGGGSIGSELCRQILRSGPAELIVLGHGENSVFEIEAQLSTLALEQAGAGQGRATIIRSVIADVRFPDRIRSIFYELRPDVVFHAAAHKHVPLMEANPAEAITNNVLGTRNVVRAALAANVGRLVMISTDKAVNPTNVMGSSKRAAEMVVLQAARQHECDYCVVRFGNVLGSRGSVLHTFNRQIAAGGPITVTHPEITRYFMTIPEAVQLLLQASTLGTGGEVFMLDMGEPVRIADMAHDLVCLSGLDVGRDIEITYTALRPGEKLYEELFIAGEEYGSTQHEKIFVVGNAGNFVPETLYQQIAELGAAAERDDRPEIIAGLQQLVPEYCPSNGGGLNAALLPQAASKNGSIDRAPSICLPQQLPAGD